MSHVKIAFVQNSTRRTNTVPNIKKRQFSPRHWKIAGAFTSRYEQDEDWRAIAHPSRIFCFSPNVVRIHMPAPQLFRKHQLEKQSITEQTKGHISRSGQQSWLSNDFSDENSRSKLSQLSPLQELKKTHRVWQKQLHYGKLSAQWVDDH